MTRGRSPVGSCQCEIPIFLRQRILANIGMPPTITICGQAEIVSQFLTNFEGIWNCFARHNCICFAQKLCRIVSQLYTKLGRISQQVLRNCVAKYEMRHNCILITPKLCRILSKLVHILFWGGGGASRNWTGPSWKSRYIFYTHSDTHRISHSQFGNDICIFVSLERHLYLYLPFLCK